MIKDNTKQIRIKSIFGGIAEMPNFAQGDEFADSLAINTDDLLTPEQGGMLVPTVSGTFSTTYGAPLWMISNPKDSNLYIYDSVGSVYSATSQQPPTELGDLTDGGTSSGNGAAYYDNYIYFARDTTVARYGPLDGTPAFTDNYWVGTLGKTALSNTVYPQVTGSASVLMPNHVMHRHSDGKLYFSDVVGNQGYIHYISTTKTTVEGDTDNSSTYQKLALPYGYYPVDIESYGDQLAVAIFEGKSGSNVRQSPSKIIFWDTTSQNYNKVVDFPDTIITALQFDTVSGVLYVFSTSPQNSSGVRISKFIGGNSFQQVKILGGLNAPIPGGVDSILNKIIFGSTNNSTGDGCVASLGTALSNSKKGVFVPYAINLNSTSSQFATCLKYFSVLTETFMYILIGWLDSTGNYGIDQITPAGLFGVTAVKSSWTSQYYRPDHSFKVKKVSFPLTRNSPAYAVSTILTVSVITDTNTRTLSIDSTKFQKGIVNFRPENLVGASYFYIKFDWSVGTSPYPIINLPITIDYEPFEINE